MNRPHPRLLHQRGSSNSNNLKSAIRQHASISWKSLKRRVERCITLANVNQREMEREIFQALHRAQEPRALADLPLVQSICRRTGEPDPVAALERVVHAALPGRDRKTETLKKSILGVDFQRSVTNRDAARQRGVSRRHFQRLRAQAVKAIARYAGDAFDDGGSTAIAAPAAHRESSWRFECERAAYNDALQRANALQMRAIAVNMVRIADHQAARLSAVARLADANLRLGRIEEALEQCVDVPPASRLLIRARHALLTGDRPQAHARAQAAISMLTSRDDEWFAAVLFATELAARPERWPCEIVTALSPAESWARTALEAQYARTILSSAPAEAIDAAGAAWRKAFAFEYNGIAARCAATLSDAARLARDAEARRYWRATAIERLLSTGDITIASALFSDAAYSREDSMDEVLCGALYDRLALVVPQLRADGAKQRAAVRTLIARTTDAAIGGGQSNEGLQAALVAVAESDSAFRHYVQAVVRPASEVFALAVTALSARPWNEVVGEVSRLLASIGRSLHPARRRIFPVVVGRYAQSQSAPAAHLRIDELAGLRFRSIPVRSAARGTVARQLGGAASGTFGKVAAVVDSR